MIAINRLIQGGVIAGFLVLSSGCIIAPDGDRGRGEHEHEGDRDRRGHDDRRCDDRDEHCRDRYR